MTKLEYQRIRRAWSQHHPRVLARANDLRAMLPTSIEAPRVGELPLAFASRWGQAHAAKGAALGQLAALKVELQREFDVACGHLRDDDFTPAVFKCQDCGRLKDGGEIWCGPIEDFHCQACEDVRADVVTSQQAALVALFRTAADQLARGELRQVDDTLGDIGRGLAALPPYLKPLSPRLTTAQLDEIAAGGAGR